MTRLQRLERVARDSRVGAIGATGIAAIAATLQLFAVEAFGVVGATGAFGVGQAWAQLLAAVGGIGLPTMIAISGHLGPEKLHFLLGVRTRILVMFGVASIALGVLASSLVPMAVVVAAGCTILYGTEEAVLRGKLELHAANAARVAQAVTLIGLVFLNSRGTATTHILLWALSYALPSSFILIRRGITDQGKMAGLVRIEKKDGFDLLRYSITTQAGTLIQLLNYRVDVIVASAFVDAESLGSYVIASRVIEVAWLIPTAVSHVEYPRLASEGVSGGWKRVVRLGGVLALVTGLLIGFTAALLGLAAGFVDDLARVRSIVLILGFGAVGIAGTKLVSALLIANGRSRIPVAASTWGLVVTITLDLILIPTAGIVGAAVASSASYCVTAAFVVLRGRRSSRSELSPSGLRTHH